MSEYKYKNEYSVPLKVWMKLTDEMKEELEALSMSQSDPSPDEDDPLRSERDRIVIHSIEMSELNLITRYSLDGYHDEHFSVVSEKTKNIFGSLTAPARFLAHEHYKRQREKEPEEDAEERAKFAAIKIGVDEAAHPCDFVFDVGDVTLMWINDGTAFDRLWCCGHRRWMPSGTIRPRIADCKSNDVAIFRGDSLDEVQEREFNRLMENTDLSSGDQVPCDRTFCVGIFSVMWVNEGDFDRLHWLGARSWVASRALRACDVGMKDVQVEDAD